MVKEEIIFAHPLDGCDEQQLHDVMMSERKDLIKAWKESEDNFIKTIIQVDSILIALGAGFLTQANIKIVPQNILLVGAFFTLICLSLAFALLEFLFSSKANKDQQAMVEKYYSKAIRKFQPPWANIAVTICQWVSLLSFAIGLIILAFFAFIQAKERSNERPAITSTSTAATTAATTSTSSTAATTSAAATAAADKAK